MRHSSFKYSLSYIRTVPAMTHQMPKCFQLPIDKDQAEERVRDLQRQLADAYELLNSFGPVAHLPDEVLSEIFQIACDDCDSLYYFVPRCRQLNVLTLTSRRWRRVANSTTGLWSTIDTSAKIPQSWIQRFLTNSGGTTLTIRHNSRLRLSRIKMITPHISRLKSLHLNLWGSTGADSIISCVKDPGWHLPSSLEHLELWKISFGSGLFADRLPSHRFLSLHNCPRISWEDILPSQLTSLHIIEPGNRIPFHGLCSILQRAPNLVVLRIHNAIERALTEPGISPPPIYLKATTSIELHDASLHTLSEILLLIRVPANTSLEIKSTSDQNPLEMALFLEQTVSAPYGIIHKICRVDLDRNSVGCDYSGPLRAVINTRNTHIREALIRIDLDHLNSLSLALENQQINFVRETFSRLPRLHEIKVALDPEEPLCRASGLGQLLSTRVITLREPIQPGVSGSRIKKKKSPPFQALKKLVISGFQEPKIQKYLTLAQGRGGLNYKTVRPVELIAACGAWVERAKKGDGYPEFDLVIEHASICADTIQELEALGQNVVLEADATILSLRQLRMKIREELGAGREDDLDESE